MLFWFGFSQRFECSEFSCIFISVPGQHPWWRRGLVLGNVLCNVKSTCRFALWHRQQEELWLTSPPVSACTGFSTVLCLDLQELNISTVSIRVFVEYKSFPLQTSHGSLPGPHQALDPPAALFSPSPWSSPNKMFLDERAFADCLHRVQKAPGFPLPASLVTF